MAAYNGLEGPKISQQVFTGIHINSTAWVEGSVEMIVSGGSTFFTIKDSGRDLGLDNLKIEPVPEPSTIFLFGFRLIALLRIKKRKTMI